MTVASITRRIGVIHKCRNAGKGERVSDIVTTFDVARWYVEDILTPIFKRDVATFGNKYDQKYSSLPGIPSQDFLNVT